MVIFRFDYYSNRELCESNRIEPKLRFPNRDTPRSYCILSDLIQVYTTARHLRSQHQHYGIAYNPQRVYRGDAKKVVSGNFFLIFGFQVYQNAQGKFLSRSVYRRFYDTYPYMAFFIDVTFLHLGSYV